MPKNKNKKQKKIQLDHHHTRHQSPRMCVGNERDLHAAEKNNSRSRILYLAKVLCQTVN